MQYDCTESFSYNLNSDGRVCEVRMVALPCHFTGADELALSTSVRLRSAGLFSASGASEVMVPGAAGAGWVVVVGGGFLPELERGGVS
jgi:hypothetical protein